MRMLDVFARPLIAVLMIGGLVAACDKQVDVRSGERDMQLTLPGTRAHGERLDARMRECLRWNPPSLCERRHPGAASAGRAATGAPAPETETETGTPADPPGSETRP